MLNLSLRSAEIPQSFRHPQVSGTISGYEKRRCGVWAENFPVVLTICLAKNGAGAGAQRISLLEVNSPFEGSTRNGVCVCVCVCVVYLKPTNVPRLLWKNRDPVRITIQKSLK